MSAVVRAGWAAVRRRRLQSLVIAAVVVLSSGTALLGLGLLVASNAPFDQAFARYGFGAAQLLPLFTLRQDWNREARVLTDQYSPANLLNVGE